MGVLPRMGRTCPRRATTQAVRIVKTRRVSLTLCLRFYSVGDILLACRSLQHFERVSKKW
jgi:hypothetical protein